ncbi:Tn7 transposase TnsA N-terminal domain-containing protein [Methylobacterium sp. J-059]|uniref:Tn7 transposase TnsA N-terminal domain-containing protein n=1 Tax=Methylobacterium sp. J-059 TaxID=2836643 RepID=UPI001FB968FF|nr:Tn7 transposase TnsA N-terminal domain-containing protein [Methylobacterium sp. J-059]MCJ2042235.1 Tn7 transposase TnsA N-terminal domain-containing protein [Methylobacterium sp. J-059]
MTSKGHVRGRTLTHEPTPRRVFVESYGELSAVHTLMARPDVVHLREQAEPVDYIDDFGVHRRHFFDFIVTLANGDKVAVAYRPHERAVRKDFASKLRLIAAQMNPSIADRVVHMSERHLPKEIVRDATLLRAVRRDNRPEDDAVVAAIVGTLLGVTTVGDLVRASGLKGRAFRAIVRLIGDGILKIVGTRGITYATRITRGTAAKGGL